MPAKRYRVYLSNEEREYLEKFVSTGANKARRITRARIFLQNLWRYSINSYKKVRRYEKLIKWEKWQKVNPIQ